LGKKSVPRTKKSRGGAHDPVDENTGGGGNQTRQSGKKKNFRYGKANRANSSTISKRSEGGWGRGTTPTGEKKST